MFGCLASTIFLVAMCLFGKAKPEDPKQSKCALSPEEVCYSGPAAFRAPENRAGVLGRLGSPSPCGHIRPVYTILSGSAGVSVDEDGRLWSSGQDRESAARPIHVSCHLPAGPAGARYDRVLTLQLDDEDDNLPRPPSGPLVRHWAPVMEPIELIDLDGVAANRYSRVEIADDQLDILRADLTVRAVNVSADYESTLVTIDVRSRPGSVLTMSPYNVILLVTDVNHPPPNTLRLPLEVRLAPPRAAALVLPPVRYPDAARRLSRAASLFARVTEPQDPAAFDLPNGPTFGLNPPYHPALSVTSRAGIVYVANTTALRLAQSPLVIGVEWRESDGARGWVNVTVDLVDSAPCDHHEHRDNLCSALTQRECLRTTCAYGLGALSGSKETQPRCSWVTGGGYSTCTVSEARCPDGRCDPLERLTANLTCLQDCITGAVYGSGIVHPNRGHGIFAHKSITPIHCSCDDHVSCSCAGMPANNKKPAKNVTTTAATTTATTSAPPTLAPPAKPSNMIAKVNVTQSVHITKSTQTPNQGNTTTNLPLVPESKPRRKEGCGFKCQTKAAIGVIFIMSSCLFLLFFFSHRHQKRKTNRKLVDSSNTLLMTLEGRRSFIAMEPLGTTLLEPLPDLNEPYIVPDPRWEFPRDSLVIEQCLGEGEFGRVLKAKALSIDGVKGETVVAVKTLKVNATSVEMADLLAEYQMMKDVSHPNVVRLLGACTMAGGPVYIIIEYAEHGSLRSQLRRSRLVCPELSAPPVEPFSYKTLLGFAWQISKGMGYLAENKLVHRDLAARNVLLATGNICKISDFGLSRDVYEDEAYLKRSKGRVPVKWMALESLADHVYTTKSDVWSYGVVLWELVTLGSSPYPGVAVHNLYHLLRAGYRMEQPHTCTTQLYQLMLDCWQQEPSDRSPFWQITGRLEAMMEQGADYLPLLLEQRLVINRGYLADCDCSPDEDNDFLKQDFGYKIPKTHNQKSLGKKYENEDFAQPHTGSYDVPKQLAAQNTIDALSSLGSNCLNNFSNANHYTVLKPKNSNYYQNDTQINIDNSSNEYKSLKGSKYEKRVCLDDTEENAISLLEPPENAGATPQSPVYVSMRNSKKDQDEKIYNGDIQTEGANTDFGRRQDEDRINKPNQCDKNVSWRDGYSSENNETRPSSVDSNVFCRPASCGGNVEADGPKTVDHSENNEDFSRANGELIGSGRRKNNRKTTSKRPLSCVENTSF